MLAAVLLAAIPPWAWSQKPSHDEERARDSDICGYRLMTERERAEYRERIHSAPTKEERERIRSAHGARMQARARDRRFVLSCSNDREAKPPSGDAASSVRAAETKSDAEWRND